MKRQLLFPVLLMSVLSLSAQSNPGEEANVVISKAEKQFKFVKGNDEHPVQIRQELNTIYSCNSYRTDIPVVEFYNDMESIDDVNIYVNDSKKNGITPRYDYYNADGIFYSDARVCYFQLPLLKKGSTSEVDFKKTLLDPRYFTSIYFMEDQKIENQVIKLVVPSWMQLDLKEYNFKQYDIKKTVDHDGDETVYTYQMKNIPARHNEADAPGPAYYTPHILVLCKSAKPKGENYTYFGTVKDQYAWYRSLVLKIGNDPNAIKEKTGEIIKGLTTDEEKVKAVFQWVQDNVRYIAFENGIAGFKPEKAQEVLRKKYGDCKGMANLLTEMLRSISLDARRCWIGTKHIVYDYSTPSLSVDNHMICAWMNKGKPVYLDATEKYIGYGEVAERIQGRQILIENGDQYLLEHVPTATYTQNTATESRKLIIDGNNLKGHVVQVWKGENKEWLLTGLNDIKQEKQESALKQFLAEGKQNFEISNLKIGNISNYNADLKVEYDVLWKDALSTFDKESYLETDNRRHFAGMKIDTSKRRLPYWLPFKNDLISETEIQVPEGMTVSTIPEKINIKQPGYSFNASYSNAAGKIIYKNELILSESEINPPGFTQWNKDIEQLTGFYNQQLVFTKKN